MSGSTTPTTFTYTGKTVPWTVPSTGLYDITAAGAQGGNGGNTYGFLDIPFGSSSGGPGALMGGEVELTQGEVLTIDVGGQGAKGTSNERSAFFTGTTGGGGGGGGGSFVVGPNNTPLVIAGGGGGGGGLRREDDGGPGLTGTAGGNGAGVGGEFGGKNGSGGPGAPVGGGGGGGFTSGGGRGEDLRGHGIDVFAGGGGGYPSLQGGKGVAIGGFGGGGAGINAATGGGGGGGGYSGGGGSTRAGGGGGGSYLAPGAIDPVKGQGQNHGNGDVTIALVSAADPSGGDPPAASTATSAADQASLTSSSLGQASSPSFLSAAPAAAPTSSIVLQPGSVDQVAAFNPNTEVLDLRQALAESQLNLRGDYGALGSYVAVTDSGSDATLSFNPRGLASGPGSVLAVLNGVGPGVTLATLISDHALAIT